MKKFKLTDIAPYSGKRVQPFDGVKRYMSTGDLKGDNLSFEDVTYVTKPSRADIFVSEGDILFAKMTNTNKALQIDRELDGIIVSTGFSVHRPLGNELFGDYFLHFLKHNSFQRQKNKLCTGAIQSAITNSGIEKIFIPVPNYNDQLHIANLLSKAESLIAQRKESIRLLDEFLKSTFLEMFGDPASNKREWETLTIRDLSLRFSDGPFGSNLKTEHYSDSGIQVIRLQNIGINEFVEKDITYVNTNHYENVLKKYSCYPNDVVIATMGEPNIRACIVPKHVNVAVNKADCVLFRVNPKLSNPYYISHLLNLEGFLFLATSFIHGQTRARISSGQIAKISIPVPPFELQTQFAQIVEKTEALKTQYQQSLQELENLYGSLSQRAFKGELTNKSLTV